MHDLHLHSSFSDGDLLPAALIDIALSRGITGISLTDHNGLWGIAAAADYARQKNIAFLAGIEITALYQGVDVHILGYSHSFREHVIAQGLATTRAGYASRIQTMVQRCQAAGYPQVTFEKIITARQQQKNPSYISYDVTKQLQRDCGLDIATARRLTVRGGACYVPYGDWALTPAAVIALLHEARASAILAHPGTVVHEAGEPILQDLLAALVRDGIDGIEVHHPFHTPDFTARLATFAQEQKLLVTGGSDWHGPGRFHDAEFGRVGVTDEQFKQLKAALP